MTTSIEKKYEIHKEILSLLDTTDIYKYKDLLFINKKGLRKIALAYDLNVTVSDNTLSETLFISTIRVTNTSGRYIEANASQKLTEDCLFDIEKAQSRATNRAIYDLYSLQELDLSGVYQADIKESEETKSDQTRVKGNYRSISPKQKSYLKRLIGEGNEQSEYHRELIASLDELSMHEAGKLIHEMLENKEVTT